MLAQQLHIYRDTYNFVIEYIKRYQNMRVLHRHTLGKQIYSMSLLLFEIIENANRHQDTRGMYLDEYLVKLNTIKTLIRLARDSKIMCEKDISVLGEQIVKLSKQATAWKNAQSQNARI